MPVLEGVTLPTTFRESSYSDDNVPGEQADSYLWRRYGASSNEMPAYTHERMIAVSTELYRVNPISKRIVDLNRDYVLGGEGLSFFAKDPVTHSVIESFWSSPFNDFPSIINTIAKEYGLYGELFLPASVGDAGQVRISYISPSSIYDILISSHYEPIAIVPMQKDALGPDRRELQIIRPVEPEGHLEGQIFFFKNNSPRDTVRGISDLFALGDWCDVLDQLLFNAAERSSHVRQWLWDVTMEGASKEDIEAEKNAILKDPPRSGSFRIHNERVKWMPISPTINAVDTQKEAQTIKSYILGGAGFPSHFFADPGEVGRTTAGEMQEATYKRLSFRQSEIVSIVTYIIHFVVDQAVKAGWTIQDPSFKIIAPKISMRELQRSGGALSKIVDAVAKAEELQWVTNIEASTLFRSLVTYMGFDLESNIANLTTPEPNSPDIPQFPPTQDPTIDPTQTDPNTVPQQTQTYENPYEQVA